MNTKHVLMAMSLPLFFAACTSDDFESQNVNVNEAKRPVVGDVSIVLGGDAMSRVADPESGKLALTENMGAVLMDTPTGTGTTFAQKYTLSNTVATDYPFIYDDVKNTWSTTGLLLEGNYFFYYPAKAEGMARQKFTYKIAEEQKAYDAEGNYKRFQAVTDNQLYISYNGFEANTKLDGEEIKINLPQAHAQVQFNVMYNGEHQIKIHKIVLETKSGEFITEGYLDVENSVYNNKYELATSPDSLKTTGPHKLPALYNVYNKAAGTDITDAANNPLNITSAFKKVKASSSISVELKNKTLSKGESVAAAMIVPSTVDSEGFVAKIYTDKGIVTYNHVGSCAYVENVTAGGITKNDTVATAQLYYGQALKPMNSAYNNTTGEFVTEYVAAEDAKLDSVLAQTARNLILGFKDQAIEVEDNFTVKSTDDLAMYLGYHEFQAYTEDHAITATLAADGIELNQASYTILKNNPKIKLTVKAETDKLLTIGSDVKATDALHKLTWGDKVDAAIEAGATQVMNAGISKRIFNSGTLTIANYDGEGNPVETATDNIFNVGTLVVNTPITAPVINGTLATVGAQRTYDNVVSAATATINANMTNNAGLINFATATVTANSIVKITNNVVTKEEAKKIGVITVNDTLTATEIVNEGTIDFNEVVKAATVGNEGTITFDEATDVNALTNSGSVTVAADKTMNITGTSTTSGTFTNNGYLKISGNLTNTGTLTNNYALTNQGSGSFTNNHKIIVNTAAIYTYLTNNENGEITIYSRDEEVKVGNGSENQGTIVYTAVENDYTSGAFTSKKNDKFNKLIVEKAGADLSDVNKTNGGLTADSYTQVLSLVLNVNSTCSYTFKDNASFANLTVGKADNTSKCTISANANGLNITNSLTVCPKTEFHITTGNSVTYSGSEEIVNEGTILVGGTFTVTNFAEPTDPAVANKYETAGDGSILWSGN